MRRLEVVTREKTICLVIKKDKNESLSSLSANDKHYFEIKLCEYSISSLFYKQLAYAPISFGQKITNPKV